MIEQLEVEVMADSFWMRGFSDVGNVGLGARFRAVGLEFRALGCGSGRWGVAGGSGIKLGLRS